MSHYLKDNTYSGLKMDDRAALILYYAVLGIPKCLFSDIELVKPSVLACTDG